MSEPGIRNSAAGAASSVQNQPTGNGESDTPVDPTSIRGVVKALYEGLSSIGYLPKELRTVCTATKDFIHPALLSFKKACDDTQTTVSPKTNNPTTHTAYPTVDSIIQGFQAHQDPSPEENELAPLSDGELFLKALYKLFDAVSPKEQRNFRREFNAPKAWHKALTEFLSHPVHGIGESSQLWRLPLAELSRLKKHYPPMQENKIGQIIFKIESSKKSSIESINTIPHNTSNT